MYGGARAFDSGLIEEDPAFFSCAGSAGASVHGDWELQDCITRTVEQGFRLCTKLCARICIRLCITLFQAVHQALHHFAQLCTLSGLRRSGGLAAFFQQQKLSFAVAAAACSSISSSLHLAAEAAVAAACSLQQQFAAEGLQQ